MFLPDKRSVYFNSLALNKEYGPVFDQGINLLNVHQPLIFTNNNLDSERRFEQCLEILQKGILQEQKTEQLYIQRLLNSIEDKQLKKDLIKIYDLVFPKNNNDSFNYIQFIRLINNILTGSENFSQILKLEKQRLRELQQAMKTLKSKLEDQILEENKKNNINKNKAAIKKEINQILDDIYLEQHTYSNSKYHTYFYNITPTIDNILADAINKIIENIFKSSELLIKIKEAFQSNEIENNTSLKMFLLNHVLQNINTQIPTLVDTVLNKSKIDINDITQKILEQQFSKIFIKGQTEKQFTSSKFSNIKEDETSNKLNITGNKLTEQLLKIYNTLREENDNNNFLTQILNQASDKNTQLFNKITNQNDKQNINLFTLLDELKKMQDSYEKELIQTNKNKNSKEKSNIDLNLLINQLKRYISSTVRQELQTIINNKLEEETTKSIKTQLKNIFTQNDISISGPQFSEIIDTVIQQTFSDNTAYFSGPKNLKADTITIQLTPKKPKSTLNEENIINTINNYFKGMNINNSFYDTFQENLPKSGHATSFKQGKKAWVEAINNLLEQINQNNDVHLNKERYTKKLQTVAKIMQDTIVVTETMKTFNQYNNKLGFLSGSLGPNIPKQLDNIQTLFTAAGVPLSYEELVWLEIALVNCSPYTLGFSNKGPIERYLSLVAGFAVFDEGAVELETIVNKNNNYYIEYSPKIMHLYKLNGIYYPGSYILSRIYDNLQQTTKQILSEKNTDGVKIRADSSPENLLSSKDNAANIDTWKNIYEKALKNEHTSIEINFLSNVVNIIKQLQDAEKDI